MGINNEPPLSSGPRAGGLFYGWWILLLASASISVGAGIMYHGFSVFFLPLKRDLGVSSAAVSLLYGAARLEGGADGLLIGYLVDRFGPRIMMLVGTVMTGLGLIFLALVPGFWSYLFVYVFIASLGYNVGFFHPVYALVNSWFIRRRAAGFAIIGIAASIGGMVMAPILSSLILNFGWRTGTFVAGLVILAVAIPAALPVRRSPEAMGLFPDGDPPLPKDAASAAHGAEEFSQDADFTVREALRTFHYWVLFFAINFRLSITVALTVHFVPILVWKGMDEAACAYMVSLFAFSAIAFMLVIGWIGDRQNKALFCGVGIMATVLAMTALMFSSSPLALYTLPVGLAVTMGTVPLNWALIGDFFGRRKYGSLRGIMGVGSGVGTFFLPIYAGWLFDRSGTYFHVLLTFIIIHILGIASFLYLGCRPPRKLSPPSPPFRSS